MVEVLIAVVFLIGATLIGLFCWPAPRPAMRLAALDMELGDVVVFSHHTGRAWMDGHLRIERIAVDPDACMVEVQGDLEVLPRTPPEDIAQRARDGMRTRR